MSSAKPLLHGRLTGSSLHPFSAPQADLMRVGHLDPARETKLDRGHQQGAHTCPPPPPQGPWSVVAGSPSHGSAFSSPLPALSPPTPAGPALRGAERPCQGHIREVRGETSAVKSCA